MTEELARELVIRAGTELAQTGLIVRTWGNISCRLDERTFVITPSGRSYETLSPAELVRCGADGTWEGNIKPSSERGLHAMVYRNKPDVNFVIHTHQKAASVFSASGLGEISPMDKPLLGNSVPVAAYALPGTKKLRGAVEAELEGSGHAVIMARHGALCFGGDYDETFAAAEQLEQACTEYLRKQYLRVSGADTYDEEEFYRFYCRDRYKEAAPAVLLHNSRRTADGLVLETPEGKAVDAGETEAAIHREIYRRRGDVNYIRQATGSGLLAVSLAGAGLMPLLDDFAQIIGSARLAKSSEPAAIADALGKYFGVLVPGAGALCCAASADDAHAAEIVMEKNALTLIGASLFGVPKPISLLESRLMHFIYKKSYSKKKI